MYTDQSRVENYLKRELTEEEVAIIDDVISSTSSNINGYTGRNWLSVDTDPNEELEELEPSERYFDGKGSQELYIDDFNELESVKLLDSDGDEVASFGISDWLLYPLNKTPKQSIKLRHSRFPIGSGNVLVEAVWGAGIVPVDIVVACTALVAKYLQKAGTASGMYKSESIEGYSYNLLTSSEIDADSNNILKNLDQWKKFIL